MAIILSKAATFFTVPSNLIVSLVVLGLVLLVVSRRFGLIVVNAGGIALALAAFSPLGNLLITPLEQRFPPLSFSDPGTVDGILVLGGSYDTQSHANTSTIYLREDTGPMAIMPGLARQYPRAQIIYSGGTDPSYSGPSDAALAKKIFVSFGVPADRISVEERSLTTEQNARFTAEMVHPGPQTRWLLVTNSYHMPRAMGAFRTAGFNVIAFPAGWRTHGWDDAWWPDGTATENLRRVDIAVHEWLGLLSYRLSGYSDEWFPGPNAHGAQS